VSAGFEERLISYLVGEDPPEAFEEALFAAAAEDGVDAGLLRAHLSLREGLRDLDDRGLLDNFITRSMVERIRSAPDRVVQLQEMGSGPTLPDARPADDADVFISRWVLGDMRAAVAIDLESYIDGRLVKTIAEVDFDPNDDSVYTCCSGALARQAYHLLAGLGERRVCFVARAADGSRRVLAQYARGGSND
jgi:hypothetical protein